MTIHINIGSNLGDCTANINKAICALRELIPGDYSISGTVESEPWGYESSNTFMNVGVMIVMEDSVEPLEILDRIQQAERSVSDAPHRDASGGYIDRRVDIDLIAVDNMVCDTPRLTLPHPRMHLREFVLGPLEQLDPRWRHPVTGQTSREMLDSLKGL